MLQQGALVLETWISKRGVEANISDIAGTVRSFPTPFEIILTASSFFKAFSVKSALNLLCRATPPEVLRREASRAARVEADGFGTWATMMEKSKDLRLDWRPFPTQILQACVQPEKSCLLSYIHNSEGCQLVSVLFLLTSFTWKKCQNQNVLSSVSQITQIVVC